MLRRFFFGFVLFEDTLTLSLTLTPFSVSYRCFFSSLSQIFFPRRDDDFISSSSIVTLGSLCSSKSSSRCSSVSRINTERRLAGRFTIVICSCLPLSPSLLPFSTSHPHPSRSPALRDCGQCRSLKKEAEDFPHAFNFGPHKHTAASERRRQKKTEGGFNEEPGRKKKIFTSSLRDELISD